MRIKYILFFLFVIGYLDVYAQPMVRITGKITNEDFQPLPSVAVSILGQSQSVRTDKDGEYVIYSKTTVFTVKYSLLGYNPELIRFIQRRAGRTTRDIVLRASVNELEQVSITDKQNQLSNTTTINIADIRSFPSVSANFESILKTLPGVSVNNELSAQYSVRGGNFDENLLYINDIEINRPVFLRNGQQEGLSMINSDLVSKAKFSAGGFEARYADKLSSVLDVQYNRPDSNQVILSAGMLSSSAAIKQSYKKSWLLAGVRYKNNRSVLARQDVKGSYNPNFADLQLMYAHDISPSFNIGFTGSINGGMLKLVPESRETEFGTLSTNLHLNVGYTGMEKTTYFTSGGAVTTTVTPKRNWLIKWINSYFSTVENENSNIVGTYLLDEITLNKPLPGNVGNDSSTGSYLNYTDNHLRTSTFISELKSEQNLGNHIFAWGLKYQRKQYVEQLNELNLIAFYTPASPANLYTDYILLRNNSISMEHFSAFIQDSYRITRFTDLQLGVRASYNSLNKKVITLSPRLLLAYRPTGDNKIVRLSAGVYTQDPDYRTIKDVDGSLNMLQKTQRSFNTSVGFDYAFSGLGTRLKFTSEVYLKYSDRIVPYIVDNLKIRYLAGQNAKGYTYGADFTLGGEFVKDLVSYFRVSLLKAEHDIESDDYMSQTGNTVNYINQGTLKRPTDQRINFSVFFQDRLLTSPTYKVHLNVLYGSRMPVGAPNLQRYSDNFRLPAYKRADIGFSKDFLDDAAIKKPAFLSRYFSAFIAYFEVFNFLNINNTASYLWLKDVNSIQYAVPNYLTGRQLNFKLIAKFKSK
ncbi:MAG: TonB-dependent receptor [Pedobacter sp.]|nr:MAG: TonB-dependent receptor [Pedobacter sp.]